MTATPTAAPARKPRRRLWRFLRRTTLVVLILAVLVRIALPFALPWLVDLVARGAGITVRWDSLSLSILAGDVQIQGLEVHERDDQGRPRGEALLRVDLIAVDLLTTHLLSGEVHVALAEVDGVDARLERDTDGHIAGAGIFAPAAQAAAPAVDDAASASNAPLDLRLPAIVDVLRVQHLRIHVRDHAAGAALDTWIETNLRINDLGRSDRTGRVEVHAHGPDLLDEFSCEGRLRTAQHALDGSFRAALRGLRLQPVAPLLALAGVTPRAKRIDATFALALQADSDEAGGLHAALEVSDLSAHADDIEGLGLDRAKIDLRREGDGNLAVSSIEVLAPRGRVDLAADGALGALGVELRAKPATTAPPQAPQANAVASRGALRVDRLHLQGGDFRAVDHRVEPSTELQLAVDEFDLGDLRLDPRAPDARARVTAKLRVPEVAEAIDVTAELTPFATRRAAKVDVRASGITLARLAPHLRRAGLQPQLKDGVLTLHAEASTRSGADDATLADLTLGPIRFADGDTTLVGLQRVGVQGLVAVRSRTRVEDVEISGLAVPLRIGANDALEFAGLRSVAAQASPAATEPAPPAPSTPPPALLPRFELGVLRVRDTELRILCDTVDPPLDFRPQQIEVDVTDLGLGGAPRADAMDEARVRVRVVAPTLADELVLNGTIRSRPGPLDLGVLCEMSGSRIVAGPLAPLLARAGIDCRLASGRAHAVLEATAKQQQDGTLEATAALREVAFADGGDTPFVALSALHVEHVRIAGPAIDVGPITIDAPQLELGRDADGALRVGPLRILPREGAGTAAAPAPAPSAPSPLPQLTLAGVTLRGARIGWSDATPSPAIETALALDAQIGALRLGTGAEPTDFVVTAHSDGAIDRLTLSGKVNPDPSDLRLEVALRGEGLRAGPLASALPPSVHVDWQTGRLAADAELRVTQLAQGGIAVDAFVHDVSLADGDTALRTLERLALRAPRIDQLGGEIAVQEITSQGLSCDVERDPEGALHLLGMRFLPATTAAPRPVEPSPAVPAPIPAPAALPHVVVERLDLGIARLRFTDHAAGAEGVPLDSSLRVFTSGPLTLCDKQPEALAPLELRVEGRAAPLLDQVALDLSFAPWQPEVHVAAKLRATGIHGGELGKLMPSLAERIDASTLGDGTAQLDLIADVDLHRRHPTDIDLGRGFGVELELRDIALRATPDGEVLAGIQSITVDAPRIATDGSARIDLIDVAGITARGTQTAEGLTLAGITLKEPPAPPAQDGAATAAEPARPATPPAAAPSTPRPEVRVGELSVRGIDFLFRDETSTPPMVLPLDSLDVEVRGFTTRTLTDGVPFRFTASLGAGKVDLPERIESSSLITGFLGAAVGAVTGSSDDRNLVQRPLLDEIAVDGNLALGPALSGRVRASVSGLELGAFRGPARKSKVEIGDGVVESGVTLQFLGENGLRTDGSIGFNNLSVSEPAGGPISTYLKLPAPLDTVLFALQDQNGDIRIPFKLRIDQGGLSSGQIATAAITALGKVIADAVAAAPFRAVGIVTGLFGLGGKAPSLAEQKVEVVFDTGDAAVSANARAQLAPLIDLLAGDESIALVVQQKLSAADLQRAQERANPTPEEARTLADRLRRGIATVQREREEAVAHLRATIGAGDPRSGWLENRHLRAIDAQLASLSNSLDRVLTLLRPGADRRADRRTRDAAIDLGTARLEEIRQTLLTLGGPTLADRIELRPARVTDPDADKPGTVTLTPRFRQPQEALGPKKQAQPIESLPPIDAKPASGR